MKFNESIPIFPHFAQLSQVAEALVKKHPCLKEPGSFNGCYGWIQRLKYKMNNFRFQTPNYERTYKDTGTMSKVDRKNSKAVTPVEVVQKKNCLVKNIAKISEKWHKRWPNIRTALAMVEGTLNPDVVKTMKVLVSTYKADQKKGKKGEERKEKRQMELGILQLFEEEGQRLIEAANEKLDQGIEKMNKNAKETEKLMAEINTPFSHVDAVKKPPPYEKEVKFKEIYPQLPCDLPGGKLSNKR
ncbi:hypothetical protein L3Q82_020078 [Scortum barcoo]|uniref:Uncharacterized protein n=1 Tax=Scortum barcoo TaxID=214431 RepID=A0ACB8VF84_9TELE|nr:hypothetical protein L3Q82_020078 [Scortum barcoo]